MERQPLGGEGPGQAASSLLHAINAVFRRAGACETEEELARTCLAVAEELTGSSFGFIGELNDEGRVDSIAISDNGWEACRMPESEAPVLIRDMLVRGLFGEVLQDGSSLVTNDPVEHPAAVGLPDGHPALTCFLGVPLRLGDEVIGMIGLANRPGGYRAEHRETVEALSVAVVEALMRKRAEVRLTQKTAELERVNQALAQREEINRTLVETSPDGIVYTDLNGRIIKANQQAAELVGFPNAEALEGQDGVELLAPFDRDRARPAMARMEDEKRSHGQRYTLQRTDGTTFVAEVAAALVPGSDHRPAGFITIFRDVSDELEVQARLAQSDRLVSIGMMAAGVAHEINNLLTYVLNNVEVLAQDLPLVLDALSWCRAHIARNAPADTADVLGHVGGLLDRGLSEDLVDSATEAVDGARRVQHIVRDMKMFAKVDDDSFVEVPINAALESAINIAHGEIKRRARLVKDLGDVPGIFASEGRLCQVFLNLLINAAQAIVEGDALGNEILVRTWADAGDVFAEVRDTGCGISTEHRGRLFDPFFTTKARGVGSGLGLALSQNIIKEYGGSIEVHSAPGEGSRFIVRLPRSPVLQKEPLPPPPAAEQRRPSGRGRILVVDDEPSICAALRRVLGREHDVVEATSGLAAQALLEDDVAFDVILRAVVMPDLSGVDLHHWIAERHEDLAGRMVFVTGGAYSRAVREFLRQSGHLRVAKPFQPSDILSAVEQVRGRDR